MRPVFRAAGVTAPEQHGGARTAGVNRASQSDRLFMRSFVLQPGPIRRQRPSSLADALLDELDPVYQAKPLRLGLLATSFALVQLQLGFLKQAQADIA